MQSFVAQIAVALAVLYIAWRGWQMLAVRKSGGCASGCSQCPGGGQPAANLVTIEPIHRPPPASSENAASSEKSAVPLVIP